MKGKEEMGLDSSDNDDSEQSDDNDDDSDASDGSDANDDSIIWSNKYDRVLEDIFDLQDEIVRKISITLLGEIEISSLQRSKRKPTENISSYEYLLRVVKSYFSTIKLNHSSLIPRIISSADSWSGAYPSRIK